jgi:disulfide bond formation protein DsbB
MKRLIFFLLFGLAFSVSYAQKNPFKKGQIWTGFYECNAERLSMEIAIQDVQGNTIISEYRFKGGAGSFGLIGKYRSGEFTFQPTHWIKNPGGYTTLGLHGFYLDAPSRLIGNTLSNLTFTEGGECNGFSLTKKE